MFREPEKRIFSYHNGKMVVHADPLALRRKLIEASGGNLTQMCLGSMAAAEGVEEDAQTLLARAAAQGQLLAVVRQAFGLAAWDEAKGDGVQDAHCWDLLDGFHVWIDGKKKAPDS